MKIDTTNLSKLAYLSLSLLIVAFSSPVNAFSEAEVSTEADTEEKRNTIYFPQFQLFETVKHEAEMSGRIYGRLSLVDECLRVVTRQGSFLLIWPGWYDFAIDGRKIVVSKINADSELTRLKIGDKVSLSGAELVYFSNTTLQYKIPEQCLAPIWAVGDIESVKTEVEKSRYSYPVQKQFQKPVKVAERPVKIVVQSKKELPKSYKGSEQANKQLKKLDMMLEKTMLK